MPTRPIPFRLDEFEQQALKEVAARLQRNSADTVRLLIRETWTVMKEIDSKPGANEPKTPVGTLPPSITS